MCARASRVSKTASAVERVARGAALLDAVYGTKWFRTENVSLGELYAGRQLFEKLGDGWKSLTEKAKKSTVGRNLVMLDDENEIDGEAYGFYGGDPAGQREAWVNEIRRRRYNRPSRRRVSTETAREVRSMARATA